jgi:hypothetical protein
MQRTKYIAEIHTSGERHESVHGRCLFMLYVHGLSRFDPLFHLVPLVPKRCPPSRRNLTMG